MDSGFGNRVKSIIINLFNSFIMVYKKFLELKVNVTDIGRYFTIDAIEYKFVYCVGYRWMTPGHEWDSIAD